MAKKPLTALSQTRRDRYDKPAGEARGPKRPVSDTSWLISIGSPCWVDGCKVDYSSPSVPLSSRAGSLEAPRPSPQRTPCPLTVPFVPLFLSTGLFPHGSKSEEIFTIQEYSQFSAVWINLFPKINYVDMSPV